MGLVERQLVGDELIRWGDEVPDSRSRLETKDVNTMIEVAVKVLMDDTKRTTDVLLRSIPLVGTSFDHSHSTRQSSPCSHRSIIYLSQPMGGESPGLGIGIPHRVDYLNHLEWAKGVLCRRQGRFGIAKRRVKDG